jgi:hypothetical protein
MISEFKVFHRERLAWKERTIPIAAFSGQRSAFTD